MGRPKKVQSTVPVAPGTAPVDTKPVTKKRAKRQLVIMRAMDASLGNAWEDVTVDADVKITTVKAALNHIKTLDKLAKYRVIKVCAEKQLKVETHTETILV